MESHAPCGSGQVGGARRRKAMFEDSGKVRIKRILSTLARLLAVAVVLAVTAGLAFAQDKPLTREQVIRMSKAGLSDEVIVAQIKAQPAPMKINTDDLIALKSAGVSDAVIRALVSPASAGAPAATAGAPAASATSAEASEDADNPNSPHDPGVYLYTTDRDGKPKMIFIDQVGAGREKSHGSFFHGANRKAELPGPRAAVRTSDDKPVFYMYFSTGANISDAGSILSPAQFSLLLLDQKPDHRETIVAHVGWSSVSVGTDAKKASLFDSQRIRPYTYKVVPRDTLRTGEYAFIATTSMAGSAKGATVVIYDFGVDNR
jgi:hypothetical protein